MHRQFADEWPQLPSINGANVTNVDASSVGGASASDVAKATSGANNATDANTAGMMVKRDAAGGFTAGTITATLNGNAASATNAAYASYADGKQGTAITASAGLQLPTDGNMFSVTGTTAIASISSNRNAGARVTLRFLSGVRLVHSASLVLSGRGDFTTSPDDIFDFLYLGGNAWHEVARAVTADSEIFYSGVAGATISNTAGGATLSFPTKHIDRFNEWSGSDFTAKQDGLYAVSASFFASPPLVGSYCNIALITPHGAQAALTEVTANFCNPRISIVITLTAGETISLQGYTSSTGTTLTHANTDLTYVRVTRMR